MIRAAIQNGWFDEEKIIFETMMCFKRAGCDGIITYFAPFVAKTLINKTWLDQDLYRDVQLLPHIR